MRLETVKDEEFGDFQFVSQEMEDVECDPFICRTEYGPAIKISFPMDQAYVTLDRDHLIQMLKMIDIQAVLDGEVV